MDAQHEKIPDHGSTLQQLLQALNAELLAQTASGKLASDLSEVRLNSTRSVPIQLSYLVFSSVAWS